MPLPLTADSLDAIPEAARGAYVQKDGKYTLDATFEDTSGLKAKNAELIAKNKQLAERAGIIGERTPEEVQADLDYAKQAREEKAKAAGDFEQLKKIQADEIAKRDKMLADLRSARESDHRKRVVVEAINGAGGKAKKLAEPVSKFVKIVEENGELVEQVVDKAGKVRLKDGQGTPMTVADLVEEFKADPDYEVDFAPSGASGSGARNENGAGNRAGLVLIPKDATPQEYRRLKAEAEKAGRPYQVAS